MKVVYHVEAPLERESVADDVYDATWAFENAASATDAILAQLPAGQSQHLETYIESVPTPTMFGMTIQKFRVVVVVEIDNPA